MSVLPPMKTVEEQVGISPATSSGSSVFHIEAIFPCVDDGRFPVNLIAGEAIEVWADIFRGGHDIAAATICWRLETEIEWHRAPMRLHGNDRWTGTFTPQSVGRHVYAIEAWTDAFATWRHGELAKIDAGQDVSLDDLECAAMMTRAAPRDKATGLIFTTACEAFLQNGGIAPHRRRRRGHGQEPAPLRSHAIQTLPIDGRPRTRGGRRVV